MLTHKLTDCRGEPGWLRARLANNKIVLQGEPHGSDLKQFALENEAQVIAFICHLESLKGKSSYEKEGASYKRTSTRKPQSIRRFFRGRMEVGPRRKGISIAWLPLGNSVWGCRINPASEEVDRFIHDLMHLAWIMYNSPQ